MNQYDQNPEPSPLRALLIVVPLAIIVALGSNLLGFWQTTWQREARAARDVAARTQPAPAPYQRDNWPNLDEIWKSLRAPEEQPQPTPPETRDTPKWPPLDAAPPSASDETGFNLTLVMTLIGRSNPNDGARAFNMCAACHSAEKDAADRVGPNLWGIIGRKVAARPGYSYSRALRDMGGEWTEDILAIYLHNPRTFVPGTKMAFAGINNNKRMADLIAYLRTRAD